MTHKGERKSAKIYQFPVRRAHRDRRAGSGAGEVNPAMEPRIDVDGAWYHQAEIDRESPRRDQ